MPENTRISNLRILPVGWDKVTQDMAEKAKVTVHLAHALVTSLGRSAAVSTIEYKIKTALGENEVSIKTRSLATRIANTDPSSESSLKQTLKRAINEGSAVAEAYEIKERGVYANVLTLAAAKRLEVLADTTEMRQIVDLGVSGHNYREAVVELTTIDALLTALGKDLTKRRYTRRIKPEEVTKPKVVKELKTRKKEVVSEIPGISFSINGKEASPLSSIRLMGVNREAKVVKALEKALNSNKGEYLYIKRNPSRSDYGFANLVTGNFANDSKNRPTDAVLMYKGRKFKISKLQTTQVGFKINLIK